MKSKVSKIALAILLVSAAYARPQGFESLPSHNLQLPNRNPPAGSSPLNPIYIAPAELQITTPALPQVPQATVPSQPQFVPIIANRAPQRQRDNSILSDLCPAIPKYIARLSRTLSAWRL